MQTPLRLSARNLTLSDTVRALVQTSVESLELSHNRIIGCRVMIDVPHGFAIGKPIVYNVRVDIRVPEEEIVIEHQLRPELEPAIREAFDAAKRRLQGIKRPAFV